jgi:Spy/CpxP family protein refolding chaperone
MHTMTMRSLMLLASLGAALAQTPNPPAPGGQAGPMGPGRGPDPDIHALRAYLNLTDSQLQQMKQAGEQARRQSAEKAKAVEPQIREKRAALEAQLAKGGDAAAIGKLMLEIRTLEKQVGEARRASRDSFVNLLTPEQKTKFKAVEDAALLPVAAREAARIGLVPGAEPRRGPAMGPRHVAMRHPGPGAGQGPGPMMQGRAMRGPGMQGQPMQGQPMQGQPMRGPRMQGQPQPGPGAQGFGPQGQGPQGVRPQGARPEGKQPRPPQPQPQEEENEL